MELLRALGSLAEPPSEASESVAAALQLGPLPDRAEHHDLFDQQLPPYASVYLGPEGMLGGEARDRIAGFWRALELTPPDEPDHLATMLAFHARLHELEAGAADERVASAWRRAREVHLWEHLLSWLPLYLAAVGELGSAFYERWAGLLADALRNEAEALEEPERLPLHLREPPGLADPRADGLEAFERSLLSPVRSGFILTRADLARAARSLGLGLRIVERARLIRSLISQDAAATLDWLAGHARDWSVRHDRWADVTPAVAAFWHRRAAASATLIAAVRASDR